MTDGVAKKRRVKMDNSEILEKLRAIHYVIMYVDALQGAEKLYELIKVLEEKQ